MILVQTLKRNLFFLHFKCYDGEKMERRPSSSLLIHLFPFNFFHLFFPFFHHLSLPLSFFLSTQPINRKPFFQGCWLVCVGKTCATSSYTKTASVTSVAKSGREREIERERERVLLFRRTRKKEKGTFWTFCHHHHGISSLFLSHLSSSLSLSSFSLFFPLHSTSSSNIFLSSFSAMHAQIYTHSSSFSFPFISSHPKITGSTQRTYSHIPFVCIWFKSWWQV